MAHPPGFALRICKTLKTLMDTGFQKRLHDNTTYHSSVFDGGAPLSGCGAPTMIDYDSL